MSRSARPCLQWRPLRVSQREKCSSATTASTRPPPRGRTTLQKCVTGPGIELLKAPVTDGPSSGGMQVLASRDPGPRYVAALSTRWSSRTRLYEHGSPHHRALPRRAGGSQRPILLWGGRTRHQSGSQRQPPADTTTQVTLSTQSAELGQHVALTAIVHSGAFGPFSGTIQFMDETQAIGPKQCVAGQQVGIAVLDLDTANPNPPATYMSVSNHAVTAIYDPAAGGTCGGGSNYAATPAPAGGSVTSATLAITPALPTIGLSLSPSSAALGTNVTLTADLGPTNGSSGKYGAFTGSVHFFADGTELTGSPVCITTPPTSATITLDTSTLYTSGTVLPNHTVSARYSADTTPCGGGNAGNYLDSLTTAQPLRSRRRLQPSRSRVPRRLTPLSAERVSLSTRLSRPRTSAP